jgi:hypothetical protein
VLSSGDRPHHAEKQEGLMLLRTVLLLAHQGGGFGNK